MMQRRWHALLLATTAVVPLGTAWAGGTNLPTGSQIVSGAGTITTNGTTMTIAPTSNRTIINSTTFDIGTGYTVNVNQPSSNSITLDRVTGGLGPSQINGTLWSNGILFLVNPNGILFGQGSVVNVGGLLATTHDINNNDFLSGNYKFAPGTNNNPSASVVNQGTITAVSGGFAALVAPGVRNTGTITATLGTVGLSASGNGFTLDMYGDKLITLAVGDHIANKVIDVSTGNFLGSYVSNEGKLKADGGRVVLTAAAAQTVVNNVINNTGNIEANTVGTKNGMIVLSAATAATKQKGDAVQTVQVSGKLKAKGKNEGETGGTIKITGESISLTGAKINASGQAGGGTVMVGLDVPNIDQYMTPVTTGPNATTAATVTMDSASIIKASGQVKGNGVGNGGVIGIWSDNSTTVNGKLVATGGVDSGKGGRAYIFGAQQLAVGTSALVNLSGQNGGQDDKDKLIIASGNDLTIVADPSGLASGASYVTVNALQNTLANNSVSVGAGIGNIGFPGFTTRGSLTVADNITWSSLSSLKLQANENITVNSNVKITNTSAAGNANSNSFVNQNVNLRAGQNGLGTGTVIFGDGAKIDMSQSWAGVNITYNPQNGYSYSRPFDYTPFVSMNTNLNNQNFQAVLNAAMLVNTAADLQSIGQNSAIQSGNYTSLSGNYTLVQNIDLGSTPNFVPIGTLAHPFTGNFDGNGGVFGNGLTISNLTINSTGTGPVGLFGAIRKQNPECMSGNCSFGTVSNVTLTYVNITANNATAVGAIAGVNYGSIWQSSASGAVSSTGSGAVGGLVGKNGANGSIMSSAAYVTVKGGNGNGDGSTAYVGGVAGRNDGVIQSSLSMGAVTGGSNAYVGGLVGYNTGSLQDTYAIGAVTGGSNSYVGGLVGYLAGGDGNGGTIATSWASGLVTGGSERSGGLVGGAGWGSSITSSFWDTYATGQQFAIGNGTNGGATAVTSDPSQVSASNYAFNRTTYSNDSGGIDFSARWFMVDGLTRPFLQSEWSNTITNAHQLQLMAMDPTSNYVLANNIYLTPALSNRSDMWSTAGFAPIGVSNVVSITPTPPGFVGSLQGLGNTIDGLSISSSAPLVGLFGMIGQGGVVRDLTLTNMNIGAGLGQTAGALAGVNFGTIDNVIVKNGKVGGNPVGFTGGAQSLFATNTPSALGGLAGINFGTIRGSSVNNVAVSIGSGDGKGVDAFIGGLVGINAGGTIIGSNASGNSGSVSAGDYALAGGLVGASDPGASIVQSFATVTVTAGANSFIGGLVGGNSGVVAESYATGATTGGANSYIGGLAGANANFTESGNGALIVGSYAGGAVNGGANSHVGGLVGDNGSQILQSFAKGAVTGGSGSTVGGLVGANRATFTNLFSGIFATPGTISQSYATGTVSASGTSIIGGLVGWNIGSIDLSYATGDVSSTGASAVGGLVGINNGTITQTAAGGAVSGGPGSSLGGLVGINAILVDPAPGTISQSYAFGAVTGTGNAIAGGLVGQNGGTIDQTYAIGQVSTGSGGTSGGLVAQGIVTATAPSGFTFGTGTGTVTNSYFDTQTTGQQSSAGGTPVTNAQLTGPTPPSGLQAPFASSTSTSQQSTTPAIPSLPVAHVPSSNTGTTNCGTGTSTSCGPNVIAPPPPPPPNQQLASLLPPSTPQDNTSLNLSAINLGPTGGSGGTGGAGGTGGTGGPSGTGGTGGPTGSLANGRWGGNGAPPGVKLIDMPTIPLPPGSGMPPPGETHFNPTEVMFQIGNGTSPQEVAQIAAQFGLTVMSSQPVGMLGRTVYTFNTNGKSVREVIRLIELSKLGAVQPVYNYGLTQDRTSEPSAAQPASQQSTTLPQTTTQPAGTTADPDPNSNMGDPAQYVIGKFQLNETHRLTRGDNVVVAVIDSEIDAQHPDLAGVVTKRFDAGCGASAPDPHGTGMTGAIAARRNLMGVAPNVKVIAICAFGGDSASAESTSVKIIKGIDYAISQGARVINMSFAGPRDPTLAQALQIAREKGIVLIGAAGNAGPKSPPLFPGADPSVIAVTATDDHDRLFKGANQGKYVAVAAPGVDVLVPAPNNSIQLTTGTSVATAHVSGVAALLIAQNPKRTPDEIRAVLMSTAKHLGPNGVNAQFGAGLVDPLKALRVAPPQATLVPAATPPGPAVPERSAALKPPALGR